jgi:hypothetical protein
MFFKQSEEIYNRINNAKYITVVGRASINEYKGNVKYQLITNNFYLIIE